MAEGRTFIYPTDFIGFGARTLPVPNRGNVLCASGFFPFRLDTSERIKPAEWYKAMADYVGDMAIPDSMSPLPGAEILILGIIPPVTEKSRKASVRCGSIEQKFLLYPDPEAPDSPLLVGPTTAVWHETDNPEGRGGGDKQNPNYKKTPLIVNPGAKKEPLWLGQTPFVHPIRLKLAGIPDEKSGAGWGNDSDAAVLYDAHPAFCGESLHPGDPLECTGISEHPIETTLPPYRLVIVSGGPEDEGTWKIEISRIHSVAIIPSAGVAAIFWRASINLAPHDALGGSVMVMMAALQDANAEEKIPEHWGYIAAQRWLEPTNYLDDRPLLPPVLAASVVSPFATAEDDPIASRFDAAKEWAEGESGTSMEENPFSDALPEESDLSAQIEETLENDGPPDLEKVEELANSILAIGKKRHEESGFDEPDADFREPKIRGDALDAEIKKRLQTPYCSKTERDLIEQNDKYPENEMDSQEMIIRIAEGRQKSPKPNLFWPALNEEEGAKFGEQLVEKLGKDDLEYHIDASGVIVDGTLSKASVVGRRFDGFFAEETIWRDVRFQDCEFVDCSFAGSKFNNCHFQNCTFTSTNLSFCEIDDAAFIVCKMSDMDLVEPIFRTTTFQECTLEKISFIELAFEKIRFINGEWKELQFLESLMIEVHLTKTNLSEITFTTTHVANCIFEQLEMFKVWAMGKGFPGTTFTDVQAKTCGFVGICHFEEAKLSGVSFTETGFTTAVFKNTQIGKGCLFRKCDFSVATFDHTQAEGVRFIGCTMAMSAWVNVKASDAYFFESILRDVDFTTTELARAVFVDADVEGAEFKPEYTIGVDFRGTTKALDS